MTGTGTKDEPYIVDNWEEYQTAVGTSNRYIEWNPTAENKVVDFNDIKPEGFDETVYFSKFTNFNGWTLKNFHSAVDKAISTRSGEASGGVIENLTFENFYWMLPAQKKIYFLFHEGYDYVFWKNCVLSGHIQTESESIYFCHSRVQFSESSANAIANTTGEFIFNSYIKNSEVILDITAPSVSICSGEVINSRILGKIQSEENVYAGSSGSAYNVYNLRSNQPLDYQGKGISVYNSDIATATESGNFVGCTAEQLRDARYLYDLRFPIGVD